MKVKYKNRVIISINIIVILIILMVSSYIYYKNEEKLVRSKITNELKLIADLKIKEISEWYKDNIFDASIISDNDFLLHYIEKYEKTNQGEDKRLLVNFLKEIQKEHGLTEVSLFSPDRKVHFTSNEDFFEIAPEIEKTINYVLETGKTSVTDLHKCSRHNQASIVFISPVKNENGKITFLMFFRINPDDYLYPFLSMYSIKNRTTETYIVRVEKDSVQFLNNLLFKKNTAIDFKLPLSDNRLPSVQAVKCRTGFFEGTDYSNEKVISYSGKIPFTDWFLIAKINESEVLGEMPSKMFFLILVLILILLFTILGMLLLHKNRYKIISDLLFKREKDLWDTQEKFKVTLASIGEGVITTSLDRKIEYVNAIAEKMLQTEADDITGKKIEQVIKLSKKNRFIVFGDIINEVLEEGKISIQSNDILLDNPAGNKIPVIFSASTIVDEKKEIAGVVFVFTDISERKKMVEELIESKEKAEEVNRLKTMFFANMNHELRTPFVGIMGFAELLMETLKDPEEREMAEGILNTSRRMVTTLTKLLSLAKLEFDKQEVRQERTEIKTLIKEAVNQFKMAAKRKNLALNQDIKFEELYVDTDPTLMMEILNNLLNNAIKYTETGWINVNAESLQNGESGYLQITVEDSGIGIAKKDQKLIWEEFRQVSEGTTRNYQGTGLGLSIVKKYCEMLGGEADVESSEGKGSKFKLKIPYSLNS